MTTPTPSDMPPTDANKPASGSFHPQWFGSDPAIPSSADPHSAPFIVGEGGVIGGGPTPANIITDPPGAISRD